MISAGSSVAGCGAISIVRSSPVHAKSESIRPCPSRIIHLAGSLVGIFGPSTNSGVLRPAGIPAILEHIVGTLPDTVKIFAGFCGVGIDREDEDQHGDQNSGIHSKVS